MTPDVIERETTIAAPVERVWALLTEAEHLGRWFADAGAEVDLQPGGALLLRWAEHGTVHACVEVVEAPTRFAFRWAPYADPGGVEPREGNSTLVEFTLTAAGDGTRLRVIERGFASLACRPDKQAENHAANSGGWTQELAELAEYAERVAV